MVCVCCGRWCSEVPGEGEDLVLNAFTSVLGHINAALEGTLSPGKFKSSNDHGAGAL